MEIKTFESGSTGNLHLIEVDRSKILLEAGLPIKKIKEYLDFDMDIDCCLLSHYHMDHAKSAQKIMENAINLYCTEPTADYLDLNHHRLNIIKPGVKNDLMDFSFTAYPTNHDTDGSVCFLIDIDGNRVLFATDSGSMPYKIQGLSHIILECNYSEEIINKRPEIETGRIKKTHMGLEDCKKFLDMNDLSNVREIKLIHLSSRNSDGEFFKKEIQKLTGLPVYY